MAFRRHDDIMCADHIVTGFNPAAPIAAFANMAFGPVADQINLPVPLAMPFAVRTDHIKIAHARQNGNAIQGMRVLRAGTGDDALFMRHLGDPFCRIERLVR